MTDYEPPVRVFATRMQEPPSEGKLDLRIRAHRGRKDDVVYIRGDLVWALIEAAGEEDLPVDRSLHQAAQAAYNALIYGDDL